MIRAVNPIVVTAVLLFAISCGNDNPTGARQEYREAERDPATLTDFTALYHLDSGTVGGKPAKPDPMNYNIKGLAELAYNAAGRSAILRVAVCIETECDAPGGAISVTSPTLLLTKLTDREIWFQTAPGAATTVTLWGEGVQTDGRPFALAATSDGEIPFRLTAIQFPYE